MDLEDLQIKLIAYRYVNVMTFIADSQCVPYVTLRLANCNFSLT